MIRPSTPLEASVRAFRDVTADPADGSATRARVLARAGASARRRGTLRRTGLSLAVALVILSSASAAWTTAARLWRAPPPVALDAPEAEAVSARQPRIGARIGARIGDLPLRVIPPAPPVADEAGASSASSASDDALAGDAERRAYSRAHRFHFADDAPARALAAWDDYLAAYPRGVFAPEAGYNRGVCLARLGRLAEAVRALRPFARGRLGGYRQGEARQLLEWLNDELDVARVAGAGTTKM